MKNEEFTMQHNSAAYSSFFIFHFLQQVACQFTQFTSFTFQQIDVCKDILVFHTINHIYQAIGLTIQIRLVNLLDISRKYHLRTFACTGDDCLYFFWSDSALRQ